MDLNFLGNRPVQVRPRLEIVRHLKISLWLSPFYESFLYSLRKGKLQLFTTIKATVYQSGYASGPVELLSILFPAKI